jgi:hypothetical protein
MGVMTFRAAILDRGMDDCLFKLVPAALMTIQAELRTFLRNESGVNAAMGGVT